MYGIRFSFLLIIFSVFIGLQSCSEDDLNVDNDLISTENFLGDRRGNGNNNGRDNRQNNNGDRNGNNNSNKRNELVISDWIDLYLEMDRYATGMRPTSTARSLAYIHLAGYETMAPSANNYMSNSANLSGLDFESDVEGEIDYQLALNACYADVYTHFMLNVPAEYQDRIESLEEELEEDLSRNLSGDVVQNSRDWGALVANQVIAYSQTDDAAEGQIYDPQPVSYVPPTGDGFWTFSAEPERALFPFWGSVRTFVISSEETSTVPPINYSEDTQSAYHQQMVDVYEANNSALAEDGEQLWIAEFWSDDVEGLMFSPPARQISIANQLIDQEDMNTMESLYLLLKLGFSLNDAAVSTWHDKYEYMVMRPSVYIQDFLDPEYQTNLFSLIPWPNPTFPGYPSGHSTFASAAAGVFINFFGNQTRFTDRSHEGRTEFRGEPRSFRNFEQMATENGFSRIPLGVHIEMDCTEGLRLGYEIADAVNNYNLRRERT